MVRDEMREQRPGSAGPDLEDMLRSSRLHVPREWCDSHEPHTW